MNLQELEQDMRDYRLAWDEAYTEYEKAAVWKEKCFLRYQNAKMAVEAYKKEHGLLEETAFTS